MPIRLSRFEMPNRLVRNEATATDTYAQFTAEPFDRGYGHTLGNSLRRVLLSSLEGAAITSVKIRGAEHEFCTIPGVLEDVVQIVLNLKKIKFQHKSQSKDPQVLSISIDRDGVVTAADIKDDNHYEVINKDQVICHLDRKTRFECEFEVRVGRGFSSWEENKHPETPIGVIPIDSIYSPVTRVKYTVENTRVGQNTDYDKLVLDVWTDGRVTPSDALLTASAILRHHLDVFVNYDEKAVEFDTAPESQSEENIELRKLLNNANISTVGQLASKSEGEMLRYRNFGKKSLTEIREKLSELGLSLGMKIDPSILDPHPGGISLLARNAVNSLESGDYDEDQEEGDEDALDFSKLIDSHLPDIEDDE
jgi:DNA-directed RNA polymerase subunit alpha